MYVNFFILRAWLMFYLLLGVFANDKLNYQYGNKYIKLNQPCQILFSRTAHYLFPRRKSRIIKLFESKCGIYPYVNVEII